MHGQERSAQSGRNGFGARIARINGQKSCSEAKVLADRKNRTGSTGPKNTESTKFNATKHGLLAVGVTELDDADGYRGTLSLLTREKEPEGVMEVFLVESIALDIVRLRRARRLEAEYITSVLNPPIRGQAPLPDLDEFLRPQF